MDLTTVLRRNARVECRSLGAGDGAVLLRLDNGAYHGINEAGKAIWDLLDDITLGELLVRLRQLFNSPPATFDVEVTAFVQDLVLRELVSARPATRQAATTSATTAEGG